jgi:tetratricopeptide (TPR) repeat protein
MACVVTILTTSSCRCNKKEGAIPEGQVEAAIDGHYLAAKSAYLKGDFSTAQHHFEEVKKLNPDDVRLPAAQGELAQSMGQLEQALAHFERAVALEPKRSTTYTHLAQVALNKGLLDKATAAIATALQLSPLDFRSLETQGEIFVANNKAAEAVDVFVEAARQAPASAQKDLVQNASTLLRNTGGKALAEGFLSKVVAIEGIDPAILSDWGNLLIEQQQFEEALRIFSVAAQRDAKEPFYYEMVGALQRRLKRPTEAVAAFQKSLAIADRAVVHAAWARVCKETNDADCFDAQLNAALQAATGAETREFVDLAELLVSANRQQDALKLLKGVADEADEAKNIDLQLRTASLAHSLKDTATEREACARVKKVAPSETCP